MEKNPVENIQQQTQKTAEVKSNADVKSAESLTESKLTVATPPNANSTTEILISLPPAKDKEITSKRILELHARVDADGKIIPTPKNPPPLDVQTEATKKPPSLSGRLKLPPLPVNRSKIHTEKKFNSPYMERPKLKPIVQTKAKNPEPVAKTKEEVKNESTKKTGRSTRR